MKRAAFIIIVVATIFLVSCAPAPISGEIVDTSSSPAYTDTYLQPVIIGDSVTLITMINYHPAEFIFYIAKGKKNIPVHVDQATYNRFLIGDYYDGR